MKFCGISNRASHGIRRPKDNVVHWGISRASVYIIFWPGHGRRSCLVTGEGIKAVHMQERLQTIDKLDATNINLVPQPAHPSVLPPLMDLEKGR